MANKIDLIGKRFNKLVVIKKHSSLEQRYHTWICLCDCGNYITVNTRNLTSGRKKDCGCEDHKQIKNRIGEKYGNLIAEELVQTSGQSFIWRFRCSCGNTVNYSIKELLQMKVKDCGCKSYTGSPRKKDISGVRKGNLVALHPTEKRDKKGSVVWVCQCDCGNKTEVTESNYIFSRSVSCGCIRRERLQKNNHLYHNFVDGTCVEWLNSRKIRSNNSTGVTGVYKTKKDTYKAAITLQGKRYHLGSYLSFDEAVNVRKIVEEHLHNGFVRAWMEWNKRAKTDANWASSNPFFFRVTQKGRVFEIQSLFIPYFSFNY